MKFKLTVLVCSVFLATAAQAADKVKIGFLSTLSGPLAVPGVDVKDGFDLALKKLGNKLGGKEVEVVVGDDQASPEVGKQRADRMLKQNKVDFMTGIIYSNVMLAVGPPAFAAETFYISSAAGPAALAGEGCNRYFFGLSWQNDGQSEAVGEFLSSQYKNVFLIAPNYAGGKENMTGFKRFYKGKITQEVYVKLGELDYASELVQIRDSKPDAVYFFLPGGMGINFIKQYIGAGLDKQIPYFAPGYSADEDTIASVGEPMVGLKNASHWAWDLDNEANKAFVKDFKAAYNRIPSVYAFQGYDVVNLLDSAVAQVKGNMDDKNALHDAIKAAKFKSVRGNFQFNSNQFPVNDFYLRVVEKDKNGVITNKTLNKIFTAHSDAYVSQCSMK